jgi:hypothetical protein
VTGEPFIGYDRVAKAASFRPIEPALFAGSSSHLSGPGNVGEYLPR